MLSAESRIDHQPSSSTQTLPEGSVQFVQDVTQRGGIRFGEIGRWLIRNHLQTLRDRHEYDQKNPVVKAVEGIAVTAAETPPFLGDALTFIEALRGKTLDGRPLSFIERGIYIFFSLPLPEPFDLPARPAVTVYHEIDKHILTPWLLDIVIDDPKERQAIEQEEQAIEQGKETTRRGN